MLDQLPLATKLTVVREWFRLLQAGQLPATGAAADRLADLLDQCRDEAGQLEKVVNVRPEATVHIALNARDVPAELRPVHDEIVRMLQAASPEQRARAI